ncbi:hypothetical protein PoB_003213300 [Plakobranchus ocellatus]|uniref:Uncharacterized protein n=1 Tax=Plakobranchus ocellatus TaxID=259542 RepID=A0AAV4AFS3_9GAST|nr:hypothetical protein PoB_003213300 [Plakobranchus ocellatus]
MPIQEILAVGYLPKPHSTFSRVLRDKTQHKKYKYILVFHRFFFLLLEGITTLVAIAQEIFDGAYLNADIQQCFNLIKHKIIGRGVPPSRYKDSLRIQYMFFMVDGRKYTVNSAKYYLDNINITKRLIFKHMVLPTKELEMMTLWNFQVILKVMENPPGQLTHAEYIEIEENMRQRLEHSAMDLMDLYETRDKIVSKKINETTVFMLWEDFSDRRKPTSLTIDLNAKYTHIKATIQVRKQVFINSLSALKYREDNVLNIMVMSHVFIIIMFMWTVLISDKIFNKDPRLKLDYGVVDLHTETKTTHKPIHLHPKDHPIEVTFESSDVEKKS